MEAVGKQSSQGSASRSCAPGGGVRSSPFNLGTTFPFYPPRMLSCPPPLPGMGSLTDMWGTPPPLCEVFCSTVCTLLGVCYAP